jgi:hypothetical protein
MLRAAILAAIASQPGISAKELRRLLALPNLKKLHVEIAELRRSGEIVPTSHGRYRLPHRPRRPAAADRYQPEQLARMMAGR